MDSDDEKDDNILLDEEETENKCLICDKLFIYNYRYIEHMRKHTGEVFRIKNLNFFLKILFFFIRNLFFAQFLDVIVHSVEKTV
jgi:uncharacterized C2H2 Zn-finger protein